MSKLYVTPSQMREIERRADQLGVSYYQLMENAGDAAAAFIVRIMSEKKISGRITMLCGKGNNGGDGYTAARKLAGAGFSVSCVMLSDEAGTDIAAKELGELFAEGLVPVIMLSDGKEAVFDVLCDSAVIVDCVFGTGFHGELPDNIAEILRYAESCNALKIAMDIPSGGNGQTGIACDDTLRCDYTVTFGLEKIGTAIYPLSEYCGEVIVCDIGIPDSCINSMERLIRRVDMDFVKEHIPVRRKNSHKGTFGKVLNIAGCKNMTGAAALSTSAALRSGAGLVKTASVDRVVKTLSSSIFESVYLSLKAAEDGSIDAENADMLIREMNNSTVCAIGCGLSVTENTKKLVKELVNNAEVPLIIDADGINCLASCIDIIRNAKGNAAVTPHPAELARIMDMPLSEVLSDRLGTAMRFCGLYETVILAKGTPTFIISSEAAYVSFTGNPGLSRGGSGDVLTGICAGLAAMGLPLDKALACGAFIHGYAADKAASELSQTGMLPSDVISRLPFVFKEMDR